MVGTAVVGGMDRPDVREQGVGLCGVVAMTPATLVAVLVAPGLSEDQRLAVNTSVPNVAVTDAA